MTLQITGNLIRPIDGLPVENATVEFIAASGSLTVLEHSKASVKTDANGFYDLQLQYGHYEVWVKEDDTLQYMGYCIVNESSPSPMSLQELIKYTQPIPVDQVEQLDDKWDRELNDLKNEFDTEIREVKDQVVDGDAAVVTQMTTYTNDRLGQEMAQMTNQVNAGDAQVLNQATAYTDTKGNELASDITQLETDQAILRSEMTSVTEANGTAIAQLRTDMEAGDAALSQSAKAYTDTETGMVEARVTQALQAGDATLTQDLQVTKDELGKQQANWQVEAQVEDLTSSIGMVNDGQTSEVYVVAEAFKFYDSAGSQNGISPFTVANGKVYADHIILGSNSGMDYDSVTGSKPPSDATHGATQDQIDAIGDAHTKVDAVEVRTTQAELDIATVDGKVDAEEQARIAAVLAEEQARIAAINDQIAADAALDGKITAEEQARITQGEELEVAYKNYSDTVAQALIDGEISDAEAAAIAEAERQVQEAEARLNIAITDVDNSLKDFVDVTYVADKEEIAGQIDQKSETWVQLSTEADPKSFWHTQDIRDKHNKDSLYHTDTKKMYLYDSATHTWNIVEDQAAIDAMESAVLAQATADGKVDTYYTTTAPSNPKDGDIWVDLSDGDRMYFWDESIGEWRNVNQEALIEQMDAATRAIANAVNAQATADGKIETYFQDEQPMVASEGDIWFDTNDGNKQYVYQSGSWVVAQDQEIGKAIADAAGAQATADGKVTTYYQDNAPAPEGVGDLWVDTNDGNKLYRWSGTAWVDIQDTAILTAQQKADQVSANLATSVADLQGQIDDLSSQVDGQIVSWFYETPPAMDAPPTSDWTTDAEKEQHLSDLYYDTITGKAYRFTKVDNVYAWSEIPNSEAAQALAAAAAAQDTADSKRRVFVDTPYPPYDIGDLWTDQDDMFLCVQARNKTDGYVAADWVQATSYKADIGSLNIDMSQQALEIARLDGEISAEEAARISALAAEEAARASDVASLIAADAAMDGKITAEEAARIQQGQDLEAAYKAYSDTVAQALIDGEISDAEANAIAEAQKNIDAAEAALQGQIDGHTADIDYLNIREAAITLEVANVDGKIDAEEAARIAAVSAEEAARIQANNERIAAEAALDGKITDEEAARIAQGQALESAYQNYTDTVAQALIDGEISDAEAAAIAEADRLVKEAEAALQQGIDDNTTAIDGVDTKVGQNALDIAAADGRITAEETARINAINAEQAARIQQNNERIAAEAALDGKITAEEAARIQQGEDLEAAYKNYSDTVAQALIDGEISDAEAAAIAEADRLVKEAEAALQEDIDKNAGDLSNFIDVVYENDQTNLQNQLDGKVETWYLRSTDADPKDSWTTDELKLKHDGDMKYLTDTSELSYYDAGTHAWIKIEDADAIAAMNAAQNAQETADGKIVTFYQDTVPTPEGVGDIWFDTDNDNEPKRWNGTQWVSARDSSVDKALADANAALIAAEGAQAAADGKITAFYQPTPPQKPDDHYTEGDIWVDIDDGNKMYYAQPDDSWLYMDNPEVAEALDAAQTAQTIADGKAEIFYSDTQPDGKEGDLWVNTAQNMRIYRMDALGIWESLNEIDVIEGSDSTLNAIADALKSAATADGKIVTFFEDEAPATAGEGDIWFDTDDGNKQYVYQSGEWVVAQDQGIGEAIEAAAGAQATADGKVTTFYQDEPPVAEGEGDLWVDTDNGNVLYRWNGAGWIEVTDQRVEKALNDAAQGIVDAANAAALADGKIDIFYQDTAPAAKEGDIWVDTDNGNEMFRREGPNWISIQDEEITKALNDAAKAQSTADGKATIFYQDNPPNTADAQDGDIWIDSNDGNRQYTMKNNVWVDTSDARMDQALADASKAINDAASADAKADGKIDVFYMSSDPYQYAKEGDIWYDTGNKNKSYRRNGNTWRSIQDEDIHAALEAASHAQATADGKTSTFYQETAPSFSEASEGDTWVDIGSDPNAMYIAVDSGLSGLEWRELPSGDATDYDDDRINNNKLTKDQVISSGIYPNQDNLSIQSANYSIGSAGWAIDNAGNAELNNAVIRGTVYAESGHFQGTLNVNGKFNVSSSGHLTASSINLGSSASSGSRMKIYTDRIEVWEGSVLRVKLGRL